MLFMGIGSLLFELERNDNYSIILICLIFIGIYGLVCINETSIIHSMFTFLVFTSILCFMIRHCYLKKYNITLLFSLFLELLMMIFIIINMNNNIFYSEIIYILNFAFYYLHLHFI